MAQTRKKCIKCDTIKEFDQYHKDITKFDGLHSYCKVCRKQLRKQNYINNKELVIVQVANWKRLNKEEYDLSDKLWKKNNKDKIKIIRRKHTLKRRINMKMKLIDTVRARLYCALIRRRWNKNNHFKDYIGCTLEQLKNHLESKFQSGMTWENWSKTGWHIDHIIPLSSANNDQDMYKLCHYSNLQPLWAIDNMLKGSRII